MRSNKNVSHYIILFSNILSWVSLLARMVKNPSTNTGDIRNLGLILGLGTSPGVGNGNPHSSILDWRIP